MKREATISADGLYRYDLIRTVEPDCQCHRCKLYRSPRKSGTPPQPGYVVWVLCNPSKADASKDDPTERRAWGFTSEWGYGKFVFVNTNPFRSTNPKLAQRPSYDALLSNQLALMKHAREAALIVCAWGSNANWNEVRTVLDGLDAALNHESLATGERAKRLHVLELSKTRVPKHPLYLPAHLRPVPWTPTL